ncbi:MAG: ribokinase [Alphaproteobacteria bacterium]|nr:ribokinase [Alphaproteobacteria bacterium]
MSGHRVVVIGNAGLDLQLAVPRLPLAGETLIGKAASARAPGGKGLNQAVAAARCGAEVRFCAPLGNDDAEAADITRHLAREGFAELVLPRLPYATDFSLLMVLPNGENSIVSTSTCSLALVPEQAEPLLRDLVKGDIVLMQGNLSLDTTAAILGEARRRNATTILNPAPFWSGIEKRMADCDLVIANQVESEALGPSIHAARAAIVTLGADGCVLIERGQRRLFPAEPVEAIDTTGCGDAFCGVIAALLARGIAIADAVPTAQKAAAITATREGAFDALPTRGELASVIPSDSEGPFLLL